MFYIDLSVAYMAFEVIFMLWWVVILTPGTVRLSYDMVRIVITAMVTLNLSRPSEIRCKIAHWYLEFARLHPRALRMFDRLRMSEKNQSKFRKAGCFIQWFGFPAGYTVIIWSALAIELTLTWNAVTNVYVLGNTGQLIPFVVGILGLVRNLHLTSIKKPNMIPTIEAPPPYWSVYLKFKLFPVLPRIYESSTLPINLDISPTASTYALGYLNSRESFTGSSAQSIRGSNSNGDRK
ncbi:hypothetical protein BKA61DRAFT_680029 [Leptodontidium sp. MPI-SDFR-AT-0119]|nr:hypothetical protein BKA61DRAFT_680029 [Leptodontidium sp. MPI-SDFR-AT-0119]